MLINVTTRKNYGITGNVGRHHCRGPSCGWPRAQIGDAATFRAIARRHIAIFTAGCLAMTDPKIATTGDDHLTDSAIEVLVIYQAG